MHLNSLDRMKQEFRIFKASSNANLRKNERINTNNATLMYARGSLKGMTYRVFDCNTKESVGAI